VNTITSSPYFYPDFDYQNGGLLFQFILEEFVQAFFQVQALCDTLEAFQEGHESKRCDLEALDLIDEKIFSLLTGSPQSPWSNGASSLSRLHEHCLLLSARASTLFPALLRLSRTIDRTVQEAVRCQQTLNRGATDSIQAVIEGLSKRILKMDAHLKRAAKQILQCIEEFQEDENVVFFVLRRSEDLSQVLGREALSRRLKRMNPRGVTGLVVFLSERYRGRGFDHLVPQIEQLHASA